MKISAGIVAVVILVIGIFLVKDMFVDNKPVQQSMIEFIETNISSDTNDLSLKAEEVLKEYKEKNGIDHLSLDEENEIIAKYIYDELVKEINDKLISKMPVKKDDVLEYLKNEDTVLKAIVIVKDANGEERVLKIRGEDTKYKKGDKLLGGEVISVKTSITKSEQYADGEYNIKKIKLLESINNYVEEVVKNRK